MRIGITGASGLVGRAAVRHAVLGGHEVVGFSRDPRREQPGLAEVRAFGDPGKADYDGLDAVIHLAGEPVLGMWTAAKRRRIRESRVEGTRLLVEGLRKASPRPEVLVCASATGYYGDRGQDPFDETAPAGKGFLADVCKTWEARAAEAERLGMRWVSGRIGMVLAPDGGALGLMRPLFKAGLGGKLGDGKQWVPWVHVDDVGRMFVEAAENETLRGAMNFTGPEAVTNQIFTATLAKQLGRPAMLPAPAPALRLVLRDLSQMLLFSQRVIASRWREEGYRWEYPKLEEAVRAALSPVGT